MADPLTVGIVGANGQVGTELAFLFCERGVEAVPIVRNSLAGGMFEHNGFDYRLADIADPADARRVLADLDIVVIAAFASPLTRGEFKPKRARGTNEALIENSVRYADDDASVVYFSSVAAFGEAVDISERWWYVREKRHLEATFSEACEGEDTTGFVFRIGLVLGRNLDRTQDIETTLSTSARVDVAADPTAASNTVHTVTIAESVLRCADDATPGMYAVVNRPQWTWDRVFERYADGTTDVRFVGSDEAASLPRKAVSAVADRIADRQVELMSVAYYLPDALNEFVFNKYMQRSIGSEVGEYESRFRFHRREFDYGAVRGPWVQDIEPTETLLDEYDYPPAIFT